MPYDENEREHLAREAVARVVFASAPERESEIKKLWTEHAHAFALVDDRIGITLDAGPFGIVRFSHRTMLQFWLLAFAAWKALEGWLAIVQLSQTTLGRIELFPELMAILPGSRRRKRSMRQSYRR